MSKNISISEGENARVFGNTKKLKTLLQGEDAGSCFWVPEDETQANPVYIMENGLHTAEEAGEYGFSVAHVNVPEIITDIDGINWEITIDKDDIPHIEIEDIEIDKDIEITIDDVIGEVEITIDDEEIDIDPEDFDLDPDADIDVSIDLDDLDVDIVGTDLDGDDVVIDLDPITGDFDTLDCPASIQVMHVPNKTEYTDGWAIDYDGLVVQAFDADGNPWSSPDYPDGYIPAHEWNVPAYADMSQTSEKATGIPDYTPITEADSTASMSVISGIFTDHFPDIAEDYKGDLGDVLQGDVDDSGGGGGVIYSWCNGVPTDWVGGIGHYDGKWCGCVVITGPPDASNTCLAIMYSHDFLYGATEKDGVTRFRIGGATKKVTRYPLFAGMDPDGLISNANLPTANMQSVEATWESPCFKSLSARFDITVNARSDHGGSHHSGKF